MCKIVRKSIRRKEEGEREEKINKNNNRREIRSIQKMRKQGMETPNEGNMGKRR